MNDEMRDIEIRPGYLRKILNGQIATPLTGYEMKIAQAKSILTAIDDEMKNKLVYTIETGLKGLLYPRDALFFLIDCYTEGYLEKGVQIIQQVIDSDRSMTADGLIETLEQDIGGQVHSGLTIQFLSDEKREPPRKYDRLPSGLNLDAMRDFK